MNPPADDRANPSLAWVIVDGLPRHVDEFVGLTRRERPATFCHTCGQRLTLKLGNVLRHHAAHRPGADCPTARPETALHSDCKLALAAALRAIASPTASLELRVTCAGSDREPCSRTKITKWTGGWDDVRIERRVAAASQPDIILLRHGTPTGALEIVVSHPMAIAAGDALARLGIPWVEIDADGIRRSSAQWKLSEPLDARRVNDRQPWRCDEHASELAFRSANGSRVVREPSPAECVRATTLRSARVVDLYHPGGGHERFIYRVVEERIVAEGFHAFRLLRGTREVAAVPISDEAGIDLPQTGAGAVALSFRADVERLRGDGATFADSPMRWAHDGAAEFITTEALFDRRRPDPTVLATTYPRRWFYSPASRQWFLPEDMRDVRWDRGPYDPFAPHPASKRRVSGRATGAPEGSWSTFVFARRPLSSMFGTAGVTIAESNPGIARLDVVLDRGGTSRVIYIVTQDAGDPAVSTAMQMIRAEDDAADALWLSHPRDWRPILLGAAWAPAGCDSRRRGAVVIDGIGVLRAEAFVRAIAQRDRRFTSANILRAMSSRVERHAAKLSSS